MRWHWILWIDLLCVPFHFDRTWTWTSPNQTLLSLPEIRQASLGTLAPTRTHGTRNAFLALLRLRRLQLFLVPRPRRAQPPCCPPLQLLYLVELLGVGQQFIFSRINILQLICCFCFFSAQCGGISFSGATCCVSGYTCTYSNDWYSQCIPGSAPTTTTSITTTSSSSSTSAPASSSSSVSSGTNYQTYTGALGGYSAPAVTTGRRGYVVAGDSSASFDTLAAALDRSCDNQHNTLNFGGIVRQRCERKRQLEWVHRQCM
ncbi:hypothetical protein T439DRAFT_142804 [Meredithblackwellia eburnea MCA 4105]